MTIFIGGVAGEWQLLLCLLPPEFCPGLLENNLSKLNAGNLLF